MRKTYAYNSIIIGFLVGLLVGASSDSVVLAVLAGLGVAIVGFIVIRVIENAIDAGVNKAADKVKDAYSKHKQKTMPASAVVPPVTTQMPSSTQAAQRTTFPQQAEAPAPAASAEPTVPCPNCGGQVRAAARFCPFCGAAMELAPAPAPEKPAEQKAICPYCGAQVRSTANFCPSCGSALKQ